MDKQIDITKVIKEYLSTLIAEWDDFNASQNEGYLRHSLLFDDTNQRYQILRYGWLGDKYIHTVSIHLDIIDDKVWIQRNTTEEEIVDVMAENGISAKDIVLGFVAPPLRKLYAYGAG